MASADLWKECLGWFRRCGLALPDHIPPTRNIECFSLHLRDGVVLCYLIHLLNPRALEFFFDVSELICMDPDENEELCLQNIKAFLEVCQTDFDLTSNDLFEPSMLYHMKNFEQVLYTLSQLSKSPRVAQLGITGFPIPRTTGGDIQTAAGKPSMNRSTSTIYDPATEVMYMCLVSDFQRCTTLTTEGLPADPVERAVQKMLNAERNYIKVLTIMEEMMPGPLTKILTTHEQSIIFYGIKELNQIHQQIQRELLSAISSEVKQPLTKLYIVFLHWKDKLHIYHSKGSRGIHRINFKLMAFPIDESTSIQLAQGNLRDRFKLTNLLLQPIQQISQYAVLLQELLKYIPENHEDYVGLKFASQSMSELVDHVNAVKKDSFLLQSLEHAQLKIDGWKLTKPALRDFGRLFRDGSLKVSFSTASNSDQKIKYQVFLFSRMVVFCTPISGIRGLRKMSRNQQFSYQSCLILQNYAVEEFGGLAGFFEAPKTPWSNSWRVNGPRGRTSVIFYSKTPEERLKWIESFKAVMAQLHPSLDNTDATTHTFVLQTFASIVDCQVCHKLLKGLLDQGYRCANCGQSFHRKCLELSQMCSANTEDIYSSVEYESGIHESASLNTSAQSLESFVRSEVSSVQSEEDSVHSVGLADELYASPAEEFEATDQSDNNLESQPWFGGSMSALEATAYLVGTDPGTFLVRRRGPTCPDALSAPFALSVMMNVGVRHIKVQCYRAQPEKDDYITLRLSWSKNEFILVPGCTFPTIYDLVYWYSHNFLSEGVTRIIDVYLKVPFKMIHKKMQYMAL